MEERIFSVSLLREKWFGLDRKKLTLLGIFKLSIMDLEKLVEKGQYKKGTLIKYRTTEKHLKDFIAWRGYGTDILLWDASLIKKDFKQPEVTKYSQSTESPSVIIVCPL